ARRAHSVAARWWNREGCPHTIWYSQLPPLLMILSWEEGMGSRRRDATARDELHHQVTHAIWPASSRKPTSGQGLSTRLSTTGPLLPSGPPRSAVLGLSRRRCR